MKLTKKKAIELSIELWTWLAETGKRKWDWPVWKKYGNDICGDCFLCEYDEANGKGDCDICPLQKKFSQRDEDEFTACHHKDCAYSGWGKATIPKTRKKFAAKFVEQLKELK